VRNKSWEDAKLKEIYLNPIGQDILDKILLQANFPKFFVTNPIVGNLSLKTLEKLCRGRLSPGFRQSLARLLETGEKAYATEPDSPLANNSPASAWWKEAVFYQIYPRSFADGNGRGKGDLRGIIGKLDYLMELGVNGIWLSPIYDSPDDDNGYDIRDYMKIDSQYGDMADFDELVVQTHKRGMRLIMDLVMNHTSDEHKWFKAALADKDSAYSGYYLIFTKAGFQ